MKKFLILGLGLCFIGAYLVPAGAQQIDTATATITATVTEVASVSLTRDKNSVTRGSATQVLFNKRDDADMAGGDAGYMYAPYRSETNKNWHLASVVANGSSMVLSMGVSLVGIDSSKLKVWCGGFYTPGANDPIEGTYSTQWESANGWQRSLSRAFTGTVPFSYQLNISELAAGTYSGTITITLTTT